METTRQLEEYNEKEVSNDVHPYLEGYTLYSHPYILGFLYLVL